MKNKNSNQRKTLIKKQLISIGLYIALAAVVLGITSNSVRKILGGQNGYDLPDLEQSNDLVLPEIKQTDILPPQTEYQYPEVYASDTKQGITAQLDEPINEVLTTDKTQEPSADAVTEPPEQAMPDLEPVTEPAPITARVKPASGYISREFSADELIYTPTMNDFRTHDGIDITGDIGSPVYSFADGIIADVYDDPFMGTTVVIRHSDDLVSCYSNLSNSLPQTVIIGASVRVGDTIGGIGETAIIESAEVPHVHFEIYKDNACVNPVDYLP